MRVLALLGGAVVLIRVGHAAAGVDDHVVARQEPVRDRDRLIERAAGIVAQVQHQPLHALGHQLLEAGADFMIGGLGELAELQVAGLAVDHEIPADADDVDLVAGDLQVDQLIVAAALDRDVDRGALRPLQQLDRVLAGHPLGVLHRHLAGGILAFDAGDDVAAAKPLLEGGGSFEDRHDRDVAVDRLNLDAEPVVASFLPFTHLRILARVEEARMGVERFQHALDAAIDEAVGGDFLDVFAIDRRERRREDAVLLGDLVLPGEHAAEEAADQRRKDHRQQRNREESGITHVRIVTDQVLRPQ